MLIVLSVICVKCKIEHVIASCAFYKNMHSASEIQDAKVVLFVNLFFITLFALQILNAVLCQYYIQHLGNVSEIKIFMVHLFSHVCL